MIQFLLTQIAKLKAAIIDTNTNTPNIITNEKGTAYQFPNGMMICTKTVEATVTFSAWGDLFESSIISFEGWASDFKNETIPTTSVCLQNSQVGGFVTGIANVTASSIGSTRVIRPNNPGEAIVTLSVVGIGVWK